MIVQKWSADDRRKYSEATFQKKLLGKNASAGAYLKQKKENATAASRMTLLCTAIMAILERGQQRATNKCTRQLRLTTIPGEDVTDVVNRGI